MYIVYNILWSPPHECIVILEYKFYLYLGHCYIFLTKNDTCVYSLMMATRNN